MFVWWWLTPLSTILQLYRGGLLYCWRKLEYPEKTSDLSQVTDKRHHKMQYASPWSRVELTTSVVTGTDCRGSCKSNYHTITTTTTRNVTIQWKASEQKDKQWSTKYYTENKAWGTDLIKTPWMNKGTSTLF